MGLDQHHLNFVDSSLNTTLRVVSIMPADSGRAEAHLDILTRMAKDMGLTPLPEEKYPRMIERNEPDKGYYIALGIIMSVWMVTPLSWSVNPGRHVWQ